MVVTVHSNGSNCFFSRTFGNNMVIIIDYYDYNALFVINYTFGISVKVYLSMFTEVKTRILLVPFSDTV